MRDAPPINEHTGRAGTIQPGRFYKDKQINH